MWKPGKVVELGVEEGVKYLFLKSFFLFEGFLVSLNLNKVLVSKCVFFGGSLFETCKC